MPQKIGQLDVDFSPENKQDILIIKIEILRE